jgi:hypothetical protein
VPELRPAWWVVRAYLAVIVLVFIFEGSDYVRLLPNPLTRRGLLQFSATLLAVIASVALGRRVVRQPRSARVAATLMNVALAVVALPLVLRLAADASLNPGENVVYTPLADSAYAIGPTAPLLNIYPYTKDGKPLKDVLLYDQYGKPVYIGGKGASLVTELPIDANGQPVTNLYPLDERQPDGSPIPPPRVALPVWPSPSPAATPSPSPKR